MEMRAKGFSPSTAAKHHSVSGHHLTERLCPATVFHVRATRRELQKLQQD